MSYHCTIVNTESLVSSIEHATSFLHHYPHHLLQPLITPNTSYNQYLLRTTVGHGTFCDLHQHGKDCLLQRVTEVSLRALPLIQLFFTEGGTFGGV